VAREKETPKGKRWFGGGEGGVEARRTGGGMGGEKAGAIVGGGGVCKRGEEGRGRRGGWM